MSFYKTASEKEKHKKAQKKSRFESKECEGKIFMDNENLKKMKPTEFLANYFGLSQRRVQQLAQDGIIPFVKDKGVYYFDPPIAIKKYITYLQDALQKRNRNTEEQEKLKLDAEIRLKEAKASYAEMELNELKGKMHRAEDVADLFSSFAASVKASACGIPGRFALDICTQLGIGNENAATISAELEKRIFEMLEDLAEFEYDPDYFKRKVQEREGWSCESEELEELEE